MSISPVSSLPPLSAWDESPELLPESFSQLAYEDSATCLPLKKHLAKYHKYRTGDSVSSIFLAESAAHEIIFDLINSFRSTEMIGTVSGIGKKRLVEICRYVEENYQNNFSLADAASQFYITPQYLTRVFKDNLGESFFSYVNKVRLSHAITDLRNPGYTIETVAERNGFSNVRSFAACFKKMYQMLPGEYRRTLPVPGNEITIDSDIASYDDVLNQYLGNITLPVSTQSEPPRKQILPTVSLQDSGHIWRKNFLRTIVVSDAKFLLYEQYQSQVKTAQSDFHFSHIRLQQLLVKEMEAYYFDQNHSLVGNFSLTDIVLDFIYSQNLFPHIILDFFPSAAAIQAHELPPVEFWCQLTRQFLEHCEFRYGKEYVDLWIISLGVYHNDSSWPLYIPLEEITAYYSTLFQTIRSCNGQVRIATPLFINEIYPEDSVITKFLEQTSVKNCVPDIVDFNLIPAANSKIYAQYEKRPISKNPDVLFHTLEEFENKLKRHGQTDKKLILNDWGYSLGNDYLNDTMFRALYVVRNILKCRNIPVEFATGALSDQMSGLPVSAQFFPGGIGLFSHQNVKKPFYYAYQMLAKLGIHVIASDDNYIVTRSQNNIQILLYDYIHYSDSFAEGNYFNFSLKNRYTPFPETASLEIVIPLQCENIHHILITETILNREHGSAFDAWANTGFIPLDRQESMDFIRSVSVPYVFTEVVQPENSKYILTRTLKPMEIRLIELQFQ